MNRTILKPASLGAVVAAGALLLAFTQGTSFADIKPTSGKAAKQHAVTPGRAMGRLIMPSMNPVNGKRLFIEKGCISCHAVNGVGGEDAPAMDAGEMDDKMNPFDFAAKMWNHAAGMIVAQEEAFGETINITGAELGDIIAFVHDDVSQYGLSESDLTPAVREMMDHAHDDQPAKEADHGKGG